MSIDHDATVRKVLDQTGMWEKANAAQGFGPRAMLPDDLVTYVDATIKGLYPNVKLEDIEQDRNAIRERVHREFNVPRGGLLASRQTQLEREEYLVNPTPGSASDNVNLPQRKATPLDTPRTPPTVHSSSSGPSSADAVPGNPFTMGNLTPRKNF